MAAENARSARELEDAASAERIAAAAEGAANKLAELLATTRANLAGGGGDATLARPKRHDADHAPSGPRREVKLAMRSGARATFTWSVDRGAVSFDLHTDKADGKAHSYRKGRDKTSDEGEVVAICDGLHGWFWRKRSSEPLTIALRTVGRLHRGQGAGVVPDSLVLPPGTDRSPIDARAMCWGASAPRSNR